MSYYNRHRIDEFSRESNKPPEDDGGAIRGKKYGKAMSMVEKSGYVMEHLATFTVNKDAGIVHPMDGMRRLLQMEQNTGIWSQKMKLCLDNNCILITDYETGDLIESFPVSLVHCPTAFTSEDVLELYNNVLVFIVSARGGDQSEMHIFQSQSISAEKLVQDIKTLQNDDMLRAPHTSVLNSQAHSHDNFAFVNKNVDSEFHRGYMERHQGRSHQQHRYQQNSEKANKYEMHMGYEDNEISGKDIDEAYGGRSADVPDSEFGVASGPRIFEDTCSVSSEKYEREVNLLNSCFDDIEKFIARLQHAAAAVREIERRRLKKREIGDGLMNLHTRPPTEKHFIDILAKFKLSFNLLSKLKTHIHDPNAPELVHFLFTPLALIVEAARDTYPDSQLAAKVVDPLLSRETINFLTNCVSSKETELWKSLGSPWTTPEDQWREKGDFYHPALAGSFPQDNDIINNFETQLTISRPETSNYEYNRQAESIKDISKMAASRAKALQNSKYGMANMDRDSPDHITNMSEQHNLNMHPQDIDNDDIVTRQGNKKVHDKFIASEVSIEEHVNPSSMKNSSANKMRDMYLGVDQYAEQWLNDLRAKNANIVVVCYPRTANNDKELSVAKGEYLEILDDSRKWWKARNVHGQVAHVPSTIVAPMDFRERKNYERSHYSQNKSS